MKAAEFDRFLERIALTEEQEISCSECLDLVDQYVDAELAREPVEAKFHGVRQHLVQCKVCHEEYEMLRELAALEGNESGPPHNGSAAPRRPRD